MTFDVFIENEAGRSFKNHYDERTLVLSHTEPVFKPYPYPYGFILGTRNADGDCLDCFVVTRQTLSRGTILKCEAIGLMEQTEEGISDNNVLATPVGDRELVTPAVRNALTEFVEGVFAGRRAISVGEFLAREDAEAEIARTRVTTQSPSNKTRATDLTPSPSELPTRN